MAFADALRSDTWTSSDIATLIEGLFVSGYPLTLTDWTPTYGATGSMTYTSVTTNYAKYIQVGKLVIALLGASGTTGGVAHAAVSASLPVASAGTMRVSAHLNDATDQWAMAFLNGANVYFYKEGFASWGLGASRTIHGVIIYWVS